MPCKDTTAQAIITLDEKERLTGFDFSKITCQKEIGAGTQFEQWALGKSIDELIAVDFLGLIARFDLQDSESQFLLYLEREALQSGLSHYIGNIDEANLERYKLDSIDYQESGVEIRLIVTPPEEMPKIVACSVRART